MDMPVACAPSSIMRREVPGLFPGSSIS
jgi:hypothetical protein